MDRWAGKVAVVTGASSGIGEAIAKSLVASGLKVVGLARRSERLEELSKNLEVQKSSKGKLYPLRCDVRQEEDILKAFDWVEKNLGGVDILVNNAGVSVYNKLTEDSTENFHKIMDVNVIAVAICTREAVKSIKARGVPGHIININSVLGHNLLNAKNSYSLYSPSKFALNCMTDATRNELSEVKPAIKVTSLSPGLVRTEIVEAIGLGYEIFDSRAHVMPEDIANGVIYVLGTPPTVQVNELMITPVGN
ncbi:farnesol dehydrogenase-like isoform X2 [Cephus cinctus]|uniref:Farnesol dehydrogenase-like isoform X2 n=1 Tax=Cephus cinctus TaxID=211228 RepID=A0AAJ7RKS2_CEPCN|nr:farnesol dehydrogenase-like isoform X2 [Cephus cinctus]